MKKNKVSSLLDLHPTQFVVGIKEIEYKIKMMSAMKDKELQKYCDDHVIPVVVGPNKKKYLVDHHHFAKACLEIKTDKYKIKIVKDLSKLTTTQFWNTMIKNNWAYLYDQFGLGPHSPLELPNDLRCLADDPYRSLVWAFVHQGLIHKMDHVFFFEFQWALFIRQNLEQKLYSDFNLKKAIKFATKLIKSSDASHLPGYKP